MNHREDAKCLLCGSSAKLSVFAGPRGERYDECVGGCPPYALGGWVHERIKLFVKPEGKAKIIEFLKEKYAESGHPELFVELTPEDLGTLV